MTKSEIIHSIERFKGSAFLNQKEVGDWLGIGKTATKTFCSGLSYITQGKNKLYPAEELANKVMSLRQGG